MGEPYLGTILLWPCPKVPVNWMACNGALINISANEQLYSLLGTTYGGDGRANFAIPDLRGRTVVGAGQGAGLSNYTLGGKVGSETVSLQITSMPIHTHSGAIAGVSVSATAQLEMSTSPANESAVQGKSDALAATLCTNSADVPDVYGYGQPSNMIAIGTPVNPTLSGSALQIGNTGGGMPHNNLQPYLPINYIICVQGVYPPRPNN